MELSGKLIGRLPEVTGKSSKGDWKKRDIIIETEDKYPKQVCISLWNDLISTVENCKQGEKIKVFFNLESREYNSRWFTEVKAWKVETETKQESKPKEPEPIRGKDEEDFDVPF